jgi:hypothetical protein
MFMSYPAMNHMEVKLEEIAGGTRVGLRHRAMGFIEPAHRAGVSEGWQHTLNVIAQDCTAPTAAPRKRQ